MLRQDPFTKIVYINQYGVFNRLGQIAGITILLYVFGWLLTTFWNERLYRVYLVKKLYQVKSTSSGRLDKKIKSHYESEKGI